LKTNRKVISRSISEIFATSCKKNNTDQIALTNWFLILKWVSSWFDIAIWFLSNNTIDRCLGNFCLAWLYNPIYQVCEPFIVRVKKIFPFFIVLVGFNLLLISLFPNRWYVRTVFIGFAVSRFILLVFGIIWDRLVIFFTHI
jgi:hypothetical protein